MDEEEGNFKVVIRGWQATKETKVGFVFIFVDLRNITIQYIYNSIKFLKYILVRALLVGLRNKHQGFPGYNIMFWRVGWKGDQIFRYSRFSFTVTRKKLLNFTRSLNTSYFELDGLSYVDWTQSNILPALFDL